MKKPKAIKHIDRLSRANLVMTVLVFAGIGGYVLIHSNAISPPASQAVENSISSMQPQYLSMSNTTQDLLAAQASQSDTQYYSNGTWISSTMNPACISCMLGPATQAADLWNQTGKTNTTLFQRAVDSFNAAIAAHQNADGSIGDSTTPDGEMFGGQLGSIYWELHSNLDATTKANWQTDLSRLSDWLVSSGNISWYTNGNVNLGNTKVFYLTWLATGQKKYKDDYEQSLQFTISPPQGTWPGYGLMYSKVPTKADGSDGAGYLTEKGSGSPGYDGDYTQLQLSEAGSLYLYSHDPRILRLANLFIDQLLPHVNTNTFVLDATNGSRHSLTEGLFTGALATLAWQGGREDLIPYLQGQYTTQLYPNFYGNANQDWASAGLYRDYGLDVSQLVLASDLAVTPSTTIGDLDGNSNVDIVDLSIMLSKYGTTDADADINKDRTVNIVDLSTLLSNYGQSPSLAPSGQAMPVGDIIGWHQVFTDDFTTDVPSGANFASGGEAGYFPQAVSDKWLAYPWPWTGTPSWANYFPERTTSLHDGMMDIWMHSETINGTDYHLIDAPEPKVNGPGTTDSTDYLASGRYVIRFKTDNFGYYHASFLLWPQADDNSTNPWPGSGEIDFPEGDYNDNMSGFLHYQNGTSGSDQAAFSTGIPISGGWHTAIIEWKAGVSVTFTLDGNLVGSSTTRIPTSPMRWVIQSGGSLAGGTAPDSANGHLYIDWVAVYTPN